MIQSDQKKTILFAEDEEGLRNLITPLLETHNYRVIVAVDGNDALQKAQAHEGPIHLVLSDVQMPGMTGVELAKQLRRLRPDTKILLVSAFSPGTVVSDEDWAFLPKPFLLCILEATISTILQEEAA